MVQLTRILTLIGAAVSVNGAAIKKPRSECVEPRQRRAWHTFTDEEKTAYLDAELCLMETPATVGLPVSRTKFDEMQENHQHQAPIIHFVGAFLPFHRHFMWTHEQLLMNECGYKGAQPYWDEQMDAGNFSNSVTFDSVYGFGGDGSGEEGCITDGPFANYINPVGPGFQNTDHCIYRRISDRSSASAAREFIDECYQHTTHDGFWPCIEGSPHGAGHGGVGGQMLNPISSPGDPLFYLHHTWLDKLWWDWQALDLETRLNDITGRNFLGTDAFSFAPGGDSPNFDIKPQGDPGNTTTLGHVLDMMGIAQSATIEDVMDIRNDLMCYEYIDP